MTFLNLYQKMNLTFVHMIFETVRTKEFSTPCKWFLDEKLSIHFWENLAYCILFSKVFVEFKLTYGNGNIK